MAQLPEECLLLILDRLPLLKLFKLLRVNRRLNQLSLDKMRTKIKAVTLQSNVNISTCAHLNLISSDQVLVLERFCRFCPIPNPIETKNFLFLNVLSKCSGVKSIDLGKSELFNDVLLEVARRCPQLECLKLGHKLIKEDEWYRFLNQIGHQIVHLAKCWCSNDKSYRPEEVRLLEMVAALCPNLRKFSWMVGWYPNRHLMNVLRLMPKSCRIKLSCWKMQEFEDVVDKLNVLKMNWSLFGHRNERLSSLKCIYLNTGPARGVEFVNLKKLYFYPIDKSDFPFSYYTNHDINLQDNCLSASRFPCLEEFNFNVYAHHNEAQFDGLFQRMTSVKKLTIYWHLPRFSSSEVPKLPGLAIYRLKKLEAICLDIVEGPVNQEKANFDIKQLELYVDGISSLKKLTVKISCSLHRDSLHTVKDEVERLKMEQNRVEIDLINRD